MSKRYAVNEMEDDWGSMKYPMSSPSKTSSHPIDRKAGGQAKWLILFVMGLVLLYIILALFSKSIDTSSHTEEQKYIPNSPHSMGGTAGVALDAQGESNAIDALVSGKDSGTSQKKRVHTDCKNIWTGDHLVGRCFGLNVHSRFSELFHIEVVETPDECKTLCCELGDKCMTWQYWNENKRCNLGPAVQLSNEDGVDKIVDGSSSWCEADPPVVWRGKRIMTRDGPKCEWGDSVPTRCHGLGAEKRGDDGNRLAKNVCERACCHTAGCQIWQQHPERGCFIGNF